jgi:NAD(P)-dependent dehydrogenase (short-subunit alcohol dehydrogenase family)
VLTDNISAHELRSLFDTNFFGQISVTQAIVPYMRQQMNGTIAFVGSVEGWVGCEAISAYVASRWAIAGLAQSIRDELHRFDIKVTVVEPGDTPMQFFRAENMSFLQKNVEAYDGRMEEVRDCAIKCWEKTNGDVAHAAGLLAAALFGGGPFVGKELPARLVLGSKAVETVENTLEEQKTSLAEWKDISLRMESLTSQEESPESPEEDSYFPKQV